MRLVALVTLLSACSLIDAFSGSGETSQSDAPNTSDADAPLENPGFAKPTKPLKANMEQTPDNWIEVGPAEMNCVGTPSADQPTSVAVSLTTTVRDFQTQSAIPGATLNVFPDEMTTAPFPGSPYTTAGNGSVTVNIPQGTKRFGFDITQNSALRTVVLQALAIPNQPTQTLPVVHAISKATGDALPALIGISRTPGRGIVLGVFRDCLKREVSNFIATVSTTSGAPVHAVGANTFYFSSSVGLPDRHSQEPVASEDGQFMVIELGPTPSAFLQMWGYLDDAALAADQLTLVGELEIPVFADGVVSGGFEPLRVF